MTGREGGPVEVRHGKVTLALHRLLEGAGRPLLMLHGLGGAAPRSVPAEVAGWAGPIWGLDFTGHGHSTIPSSGGYTAEILMADADAALSHLGEATVLGRGLGAYVALLIAGGRPSLVRGAILADGVGLAGGGTLPGSPAPAVPAGLVGVAPDPFAAVELAKDVRPPDYATTYARAALQFSGLDDPIAVCAVVRPEWLAAVVDELGVITCTLSDALAHFGGDHAS